MAGVRPNFALRQLLFDPDDPAPDGPDPRAAAASRTSAPSLGERGASMARQVHADTTGRREVFESLGAPYGLAQLLCEEDELIGLRLFLLDNSGSTGTGDGKKFVLEGGSVYPQDCTRWEEISHMAMEQAQWNARVGVPAEFFLLNPPQTAGPPREGVHFVRVDAKHGDVTLQIDALKSMLKKNGPRGGTPIAERLEELATRMHSEHEALITAGQRVVLVLATDGPSRAKSASRSLRARAVNATLSLR